MKLILASASPRRKELMTQAGFDFEVITEPTDETLPEKITPEKAVEYLAEKKGNAVFQKHPDSVVVSADTVVSTDGEILGKPKDKADAMHMLERLSGRKHYVYTGVCIQRASEMTVIHVKTEVEFYPLSKQEILDYCMTGEPLDKAGAYGIQGKGALLVKEIHGDYFNVVGLPIAEVSRILKQSYLF